ncbi:TRAPP trafficking subunit Trs65-domain-containing protein [Pseudoneurospora amorphoporcata]|uniref:TRAPP trafficking subunit Trs65-domain-containing protein n=1 Tax=Pseudoneurospora amorphoporcata TaxID=241081 RepID=A0AAN6NUN8_9PEZI|nr:TRAPP trafficking subunit Trs65-domain-containing protein [Pseudoneurospora amorphoporcata]
MAYNMNDDDDAHDDGRAFLEQSNFRYIIPSAINFKADTASPPSLLEGISQRDVLFFDETADVYLVLRTPRQYEETLRSSLSRIVVTLEAQIVNGQGSDREGPPASEIIYTGLVPDTADAIILSPGEGEQGKEKTEEGGDSNADDGKDSYVYAIWKMPVFVSRPRMRLQAPSIVFAATAGLKLLDPRKSRDMVDDGYMQSCAPAGLNLLESFADDPMLGGIQPRLSALRVSRVAPVTQTKQPLRLFRGMQSLRLRVYPVVHTRVRFARPNTSPPSPALIALLEVDFTPFFDCEAALQKIDLAVTDGTVDDLNSQDLMALPLHCVAHDHLTFLYRLAPRQLDIISKHPSRELVITVEVAVLVQPDGADPCMPKLTMSWTTPLDFTLPVNPGFGTPMTKPIERRHKPSQLSISGGVDSMPLVSPSVTRPDALPSLEASITTQRSFETHIPDFGITVTFVGPDRPVLAGEEFAWTVFVVNRTKPESAASNTPAASTTTTHGSTNGTNGGTNTIITTRSNSISIAAAASGIPAILTAPSSTTTSGTSLASQRKLALFALPKRRRNEVRTHRALSTAAPSNKRDPLIADAVLDDNVVHAMQRSSVVDSTEVVCLSADARVGPLAPNACAVVELRFLALKEGVLGIEAVRIVDLGSQEHVDVRELPAIVVRAGRKDGDEKKGEEGEAEGGVFEEVSVE